MFCRMVAKCPDLKSRSTSTTKRGDARVPLRTGALARSSRAITAPLIFEGRGGWENRKCTRRNKFQSPEHIQDSKSVAILHRHATQDIQDASPLRSHLDARTRAQRRNGELMRWRALAPGATPTSQVAEIKGTWARPIRSTPWRFIAFSGRSTLYHGAGGRELECRHSRPLHPNVVSCLTNATP